MKTYFTKLSQKIYATFFVAILALNLNAQFEKFMQGPEFSVVSTTKHDDEDFEGKRLNESHIALIEGNKELVIFDYKKNTLSIFDNLEGHSPEYLMKKVEPRNSVQPIKKIDEKTDYKVFITIDKVVFVALGKEKSTLSIFDYSLNAVGSSLDFAENPKKKFVFAKSIEPTLSADQSKLLLFHIFSGEKSENAPFEAGNLNLHLSAFDLNSAKVLYEKNYKGDKFLGISKINPFVANNGEAYVYLSFLPNYDGVSLNKQYFDEVLFLSRQKEQIITANPKAIEEVKFQNLEFGSYFDINFTELNDNDLRAVALKTERLNGMAIGVAYLNFDLKKKKAAVLKSQNFPFRQYAKVVDNALETNKEGITYFYEITKVSNFDNKIGISVNSKVALSDFAYMFRDLSFFIIDKNQLNITEILKTKRMYYTSAKNGLRTGLDGCGISFNPKSNELYFHFSPMYATEQYSITAKDKELSTFIDRWAYYLISHNFETKKTNYYRYNYEPKNFWSIKNLGHSSYINAYINYDFKSLNLRVAKHGDEKTELSSFSINLGF
jgi:hypothetical protein